MISKDELRRNSSTQVQIFRLFALERPAGGVAVIGCPPRGCPPIITTQRWMHQTEKKIPRHSGPNQKTPDWNCAGHLERRTDNRGGQQQSQTGNLQKVLEEEEEEEEEESAKEEGEELLGQCVFTEPSLR